MPMMTRVRAIARPLTACLPIPRPASCWRRIATRRRLLQPQRRALYAVDQGKNSRSNYTLWHKKKRATFTVNQNPPDGWGGFISAAVSPIALEPLPGPKAVSGQLQQFIWSSLPVGERAASIRQTARSSSRRSYFTQLQLPAVVWR